MGARAPDAGGAQVIHLLAWEGVDQKEVRARRNLLDLVRLQCADEVPAMGYHHWHSLDPYHCYGLPAFYDGATMHVSARRGVGVGGEETQEAIAPASPCPFIDPTVLHPCFAQTQPTTHLLTIYPFCPSFSRPYRTSPGYSSRRSACVHSHRHRGPSLAV